uniref:Endothelial PAS domain protein 1b n=1 Tax=Mola mola TaxID=94237 RepID=A0A3Q4BFC2_MOLML
HDTGQRCDAMRADKEKRRAISREAARKRRRVESDMFGDLSRLLPLPPSVRVHLDKPSIIRLTLSYIRAHALFKGEKQSEEAKGTEGVETNMLLTILEGFLIVLSTKGDIIFLSDDVSKYLGMTQTELMGYNIFEFTHPCDHEEIRNNLHLTEGVKKMKQKYLRCDTLTHRGRSANLKSATWKVLHLQGRAKACFGPSSASCLLLTCMPLPLSHTLLSTHTFTSQHSMDMRFTYCDQRATVFLGYTPVELQGRSIYELCHTLDTDCLTKNHLNLCFKSQSVSGRYRMLVRGGGYVWVESHSAVIPSPLCILCVTYVLRCVSNSQSVTKKKKSCLSCMSLESSRKPEHLVETQGEHANSHYCHEFHIERRRPGGKTVPATAQLDCPIHRSATTLRIRESQVRSTLWPP